MNLQIASLMKTAIRLLGPAAVMRLKELIRETMPSNLNSYEKRHLVKAKLREEYKFDIPGFLLNLAVEIVFANIKTEN